MRHRSRYPEKVTVSSIFARVDCAGCAPRVVKMMPLLAERVVLISGGTRGLGAAVARAAAREGALVAVAGRRREPGEALAAELAAAGTKALFVQADVADVAQARACVTAAVAAFGRVDSLVNAAGLTTRGTLLDTTQDLFDAHVAVNLRAPFFLMQAVVADLVARQSPGTTETAAGTHRLQAGQELLAGLVSGPAADVRGDHDRPAACRLDLGG